MAQLETAVINEPLEFLQAVLDGIADPVMVIGRDHRVLSANKAALALAPPLTEESRCYRISHQRDTPCDASEHLCPLHRAVETNSAVSVLHRHYDRDGNESLVELTATPLRNGRGEVIGIVETAHDITSIKNAETELQTILETATDGFILTDMEARIIGCNDAYCVMSRYLRSELLGMGIEDVEAQSSAAAIRQRALEIRQRGHASFESRHRRKDGTIFDVEISVSYVDFDGGKLVSFVRDITERKQAEEHIRQLAYYDPLTGLPNRRLLSDRIHRALVQAKRFDRSIALMFLDLDRFKQVNDSLGHKAGDELLRQVAVRLGRCVRQGDTVARTGGDEFVIVLTEVAQADDASRVAEKILDVMQAPFTLERHSFAVTASIGIAVHAVAGGGDGAELMRRADIAMYEAKASGRNTYRVFEEETSWRAAQAVFA